MSEDTETPPVACQLTDEQEAERSEAVRRTIIVHYLGAEERANGYTIRFKGTDDTLPAVASFTASELQCCSFANYTISVSPPYEETRLTITGPEGTKGLFGDLVDRLETTE
jgi:hypothetical protein